MEDIALESEEKTVEVEVLAGDEDIVMLDAILTASPSKPGTGMLTQANNIHLAQANVITRSCISQPNHSQSCSATFHSPAAKANTVRRINSREYVWRLLSLQNRILWRRWKIAQ